MFVVVRFISIIFVALLSFATYSKDCSQVQGIRSIPISVDIDGKIVTRNLHYQVLTEGEFNPEFPTVLHIGGGPGQKTIGKFLHDHETENGEMKQRIHTYPTGIQVIATDIRGSGCNNFGDHPELYTSDLAAEDYLKIIKHANLSNYSIHGISYGTVQATIVSSKLIDYGLPLPQSVILEGTFSSGAYESSLDQNQNYSFRQLKYIEKEITEKLNPGVWERLLANDIPGDFSKEIINQFIVRGSGFLRFLPNEDEQVQEDYALLTINDLFDSDQEKVINAIRRINYFIEEVLADDFNFVYTQIWCGELVSQTTDYEFVYADDNFVRVRKPGQSFCSSVSRKKYYNSKNYQIPSEVKVYYFSGEHDFRTTPWQTNHHFINQNSENKQSFMMADLGHVSLSSYLRFCSEEFFMVLHHQFTLNNDFLRAPCDLIKTNLVELDHD